MVNDAFVDPRVPSLRESCLHRGQLDRMVSFQPRRVRLSHDYALVHDRGMLLPGMHISFHPPRRTAVDEPDDVLVLPRDPRAELNEQFGARDSSGKPVLPIPGLEVVE